MRRLKTSVLVVLVFLCVLWAWRWWHERTPPGRVVLRATFDFGAEMSSSELKEEGRRKALVVDTEGRGRWRIVSRGKTFVSERLPPKDTNDLFDLDQDGYPELFCWDNPRKLSGEFLRDSEGHFLPLRVYVFKRRESVRRQDLRRLSRKRFWYGYTVGLPGKWVLWSETRLGEDPHYVEFTFISEPDTKQPRKVVFWAREGTHGGLYWLFTPDGKSARPFTPHLKGELQLDDLDHDGTYELIIEGRGYDQTNFAGRAIYKWDGRTYRHWWNADAKDGYVVFASLEDLDGDGTKEIVATLEVKSRRFIAIYRLDGGRYRKIPSMPRADGYATLGFGKGRLFVALMPKSVRGYVYQNGRLRQLWQQRKGDGGCTPIGDRNGNGDEEMLFEQNDGKTYTLDLLMDGRRCVSGPHLNSTQWDMSPESLVVTTPNGLDVLLPIQYARPTPPSWRRFLPAPLRKYLARRYPPPKEETFVVTYDGSRLRFCQTLPGDAVSQYHEDVSGDVVRLPVSGKGRRCTWMLMRVEQPPQGQSGGTYAVFARSQGRYREIWRETLSASPDDIFSTDLDGDGREELIVVEDVKGKVRIFSVE